MIRRLRGRPVTPIDPPQPRVVTDAVIAHEPLPSPPSREWDRPDGPCNFWSASSRRGQGAADARTRAAARSAAHGSARGAAALQGGAQQELDALLFGVRLDDRARPFGRLARVEAEALQRLHEELLVAGRQRRGEARVDLVLELEDEPFRRLRADPLDAGQ